jgi:hypothetical protein
MKYLITFESHSQSKLPSFLYDIKVMKKYIPRSYFKFYDIKEILDIKEPSSIYVRNCGKSNNLEANDSIRLDFKISDIIQQERDRKISKLLK